MQCPVCQQEFSRRNNMLRHHRNVHVGGSRRGGGSRGGGSSGGIRQRHPDGLGRRSLLRSPNTKRDSLGRPDVDRGQGLENQRPVYGRISPSQPIVVTLNQNLFFGKDPTQRRNCHYLVLFNNPVDRQPIATLGRQMYPGRAHDFLQKFEEVTKEPYSYLIVDLKPTTPDSLRLRTDILRTGIDKEKDEEEEEDVEGEEGGGCVGERGGRRTRGTHGPLSLSNLRTRIRSRLGF